MLLQLTDVVYICVRNRVVSTAHSTKEHFMKPENIGIALFALFALGLPVWAMQNNGFSSADNHACFGDCYAQWQADTGGVVAMEVAAIEARASASPEELGKGLYQGCIACHGAAGEGGIGPQLAGQPAADIITKLSKYKAGETVGAQSALMWSQAANLSGTDIENLAAHIGTL
jgi:cytochrome c553